MKNTINALPVRHKLMSLDLTAYVNDSILSEYNFLYWQELDESYQFPLNHLKFIAQPCELPYKQKQRLIQAIYNMLKPYGAK